MSDINKKIRELVNYGLHTGLVVPEDEMYTINRLLEVPEAGRVQGGRRRRVRCRIWRKR